MNHTKLFVKVVFSESRSLILETTEDGFEAFQSEFNRSESHFIALDAFSELSVSKDSIQRFEVYSCELEKEIFVDQNDLIMVPTERLTISA